MKKFSGKASQIKTKKKRWLQVLVFSVCIVVIVVFLVSNTLKIQTVNLQQSSFSDVLRGKRAILLSDLHLSAGNKTSVSQLLFAIEKIKPDIIFLVGDFVPWTSTKEDYRNVFHFLKELSAPLGVYAVLGDSDYQRSRESCTFCHSQNIRKPTPLNQVKFIRDNFIDLNLNGRFLRIAGVDSREGLRPRLQNVPPLIVRTPVILLSHTSTVYKKIPDSRNVLVLSGDTHGGQVYLPTFLWKLWGRKPDPEHMYGYFKDGEKSLYVTSGTGTSDLPFRFGVRPEIAVFKF